MPWWWVMVMMVMVMVMVVVVENLKWSILELNEEVQSYAQHFDRQRKLRFSMIHLPHR